MKRKFMQAISVLPATLVFSLTILVQMILPKMAQAQTAANRPLLPTIDFGLTYSSEMAKVATTDCGCFWMQGASFDAYVPIFRGLGAAANLAGGTSSNITPGVDVSKVSFMAGPRYGFSTRRWTRGVPGLRRGTGLFGEFLLGNAHGFNGTFLTSSGYKSSANSLAFQVGGGLNVALGHRFGVRAVEVDYVRTRFRNTANDAQNDLRLAAGVTYRLGER